MFVWIAYWTHACGSASGYTLHLLTCALLLSVLSRQATPDVQFSRGFRGWLQHTLPFMHGSLAENHKRLACLCLPTISTMSWSVSNPCCLFATPAVVIIPFPAGNKVYMSHELGHNLVRADATCTLRHTAVQYCDPHISHLSAVYGTQPADGLSRLLHSTRRH